MTTSPGMSEDEIKLVYQLAGLAPTVPGTALRARHFDLARTQAARTAGDVPGLVREAHAQAWKLMHEGHPKARQAFVFYQRRMARRIARLRIQRLVWDEIILAGCSLTRFECWLLRHGMIGKRLAGVHKKLARPMRMQLVRWRIDWQTRGMM